MKILPVVAASLLSSTVAYAADLAPAPAEPIAPVAEPFSWTGFYAGIHAGYGWGREHDNQSHLFGQTVTQTISETGGVDHFNMNGFIGGVHAGYNFQLEENWVIGAEADIDYANIKGGGSAVYSGVFPRTLDMKSEWQGSARLRAGYAFDRLLIYATGGIAFADGKLTVGGFDGAPIPTTETSKTHVGWTAGLGAEYAFTDHWIGRVEVRYSDFGKETYRTFDGPVKAGWNQTTATAGISYKF